MTREELAHALSAIEQVLTERVEIWRIIVDETGKELSRVYRGSFVSRDSRTEPQPHENRP